MKILIVDDSIAIRKILSNYVKQLGHEVFIAGNGLEAIELLKHENLRLILTDWDMPEMNGVNLVKYIRKNEGDMYTYIIMVTAREANMDLVEGFEAGVDDYLTKPVNRQELLLRISAGERVLALQDKDIVILALAKLTEYRDEETGKHIERIREYSRLLTESFYKDSRLFPEVDRRFLENIFITSPLHDIGKVGIPDSILQKPGKLTIEEFNIMKRHTTIGFETLDSVYNNKVPGHYLKMAADIAKYHHEKWNGLGYPVGLKNEEIPLSARIVALADVYDALTSKRVYKDAFTHEESKKIILIDSGSHFDPRIVESFIKLEGEFNRIREINT